MHHGEPKARKGIPCSICGLNKWFKTDAKRCKFTNDATTIRIFIKGLENTHSLATCIYEKGPQMLTDAISEEEKFNAV